MPLTISKGHFISHIVLTKNNSNESRNSVKRNLKPP